MIARFRVPFKLTSLLRRQARPFLEALKLFLNVENAWLTFNGRSALFLALRAMGRPGSRILLPAYLCPVVHQTVEDAGYQPCWVDSDRSTLGMGPVAEWPDEVSGVIFAHLAGLPSDLTILRAACKDRNIVLIEDCAQAFGARVLSHPVGTLSDFGVYSFGLGKELSTGGGLLVSSPEWAERIEQCHSEFTLPPWSVVVRRLSALLGYLLASHPLVYSAWLARLVDRGDSSSKAQKNTYHWQNDWISNYLGAAQLTGLESNLSRRRSFVRQWKQSLAGRKALWWPRATGEPTYLRLVAGVPSQLLRPLIEHLRRHGVDCVSKAEPLPEKGEYPIARDLNEMLLGLPSDECLSPLQVARMVDLVAGFLDTLDALESP